MRYSKVTREGVYISPPEGNDKAAYATMMYVRVLIVKTCGKILEKALTIAVRYAAVRRQTAINTKDNEFQVFNLKLLFYFYIMIYNKKDIGLSKCVWNIITISCYCICISFYRIVDE